MADLITSTLESDGLLLAVIDMPDRTMNVFSWALMDALDQLMDRVDRDDAVRAVVLTSGKASGFLAGADLQMVRGFSAAGRSQGPEAMFEMCGRLGRQFVRLEASPKPWVAAVNGLALGGGLELAMACRARVVADDPRIQLGLPEIRWGLLPGAGGTQRLPRMLGFDAGVQLLVTGRSLSPAEAVASGLFRQALPAAQLLDAARACAREMTGQAYDPARKFPHLDQSAVPPYSDATSRALAARLGVSAEAFDQTPAYSAILDSVLKGARQPLAEATTIEMREFLRLMFNPVAGRMVRTLFLGRVRAERELAAPATLKLQALHVGPVSPTRQAWADALAKVKLEKVQDASLPADTLVAVEASGERTTFALRVLDEAPQPGAGGSTLVLAPAGPYGRVMEILGRDARASQVAAALAARLWTLPWPSHSDTSLLQQLRGKPLPEQAPLALRGAAVPGAGDPTFLDVAACLSGVAPGWSGGPLSWLWDEREQQQPRFDTATRAAWDAMHARLEQACT